jgi:hypothetical protein
MARQIATSSPPMAPISAVNQPYCGKTKPRQKIAVRVHSIVPSATGRTPYLGSDRTMQVSDRSLGAQRNWPVVFRCSSQREGRRLIWIELHVEGSEKRCCPGIIPHEGDEIDQRAVAELP